MLWLWGGAPPAAWRTSTWTEKLQVLLDFRALDLHNSNHAATTQQTRQTREHACTLMQHKCAHAHTPYTGVAGWGSLALQRLEDLSVVCNTTHTYL
eukprot:scaffold68816_cov23-Tisochrysis_lutea.AAC.4